MQPKNTRRSKEKQFAATALLAMLCVFFMHPSKLHAQMKVGDNPTVINPAAMFEVESTNKGILLPRIFIRDENSFGLVGNTAIDGMFIFNTNPALDGGIGMYYWAKSKWNFIQSGVKDYPVWQTLGNSGLYTGTYIKPGRSFIGTKDTIDFPIRTNNIERMRIAKTGQIGVNQNYSTDQQFAVSTPVPSSIAIVGQNSTPEGFTGGGIGVMGITAQAVDYFDYSSGFGVVALNKNSEGTAFYAAGNNMGLDNGIYFPTGAGGVMQGTSIGGAGYSGGIGLIGLSEGTYGSYGVYGSSSQKYAVQIGVYGTYDFNNFGVGIEGIGLLGFNIQTPTQLHAGVYGSAYQYGVYGYNPNSEISTVGVLGEVKHPGDEISNKYPVGIIGNASGNSYLYGTADGVAGHTAQPLGAGVFGWNSYLNIGGVGVLGSQSGNASVPLTLIPAGGAGGSFTGNGINADSTTIIGVAGFANYGSVAKGKGTETNPSFFAGGYFATRIAHAAPYIASSYAYVGVQYNGTNYKIYGTGNVSTIVNDLNDKKVTFFAPETPESLFEDYGTGKLVNGKVHINIDPVFAKNITVNAQHPLRVFIQLNGDCKGVFVANKTGNGFDVIELQSGQSNVDFEWHVIGNRADEYDKDGFLYSKNADLRMPPAPGPMETKDVSGKAKALLVTGDGMHRTAPELKGIKVPLDPTLQQINMKKQSVGKNDNKEQPPKKD